LTYLDPYAMSVMLVISLVVASLAVARLTRLLVDDQLTIGLKRWAIRKWGDTSWQSYLVHCPWCVSVWIALPVMPVATLWPSRWLIAALSVPAASMVAGLLVDRD
jgi:peptidoglycan/LPS O-acetylase OafA/YrhL